MPQCHQHRLQLPPSAPLRLPKIARTTPLPLSFSRFDIGGTSVLKQWTTFHTEYHPSPWLSAVYRADMSDCWWTESKAIPQTVRVTPYLSQLTSNDAKESKELKNRTAQQYSGTTTSRSASPPLLLSSSLTILLRLLSMVIWKRQSVSAIVAASLAMFLFVCPSCCLQASEIHRLRQTGALPRLLRNARHTHCTKQSPHCVSKQRTELDIPDKFPVGDSTSEWDNPNKFWFRTGLNIITKRNF